MQSFRALTLNIWNRLGPWEERLRGIRAGLSTLAPDVIGLQEVVRMGSFDQVALVNGDLGFFSVWGQASVERGVALGNAILSRWPILRSEVFVLPDGGSGEERCLLFAEIDAPFGRLPFFTTHLNWKLDEGHVRVLQVKAIVEHVGRLAPRGTTFPPVIAGDFNALPESDEIRYLTGLTGLGGPSVYFADAFAIAGDGSSGATFSKQNPFAEPLREPERRIDYVFVRQSDDASRGEPLEARVCFDEPFEGTFPTDHFGVTARITVGR